MGSSSDPSSSTIATPGGSTTTDVTGLRLTRSLATVFPAKDGYRDSERFLVTAATSTGAVVPVTGTATLSKGTKVVKRWTLTRSTQALTWNGRTGTKIVAGAYVLRVVTVAAAGTMSKASTSVRVSAAALVTRTRSITTNLKHTTVHDAMPAVVRRAYSKGKVFVQVTTVVQHLRSSARLGFVNGKHVAYTSLRPGTFRSPKLAVPNTKAFRSVTLRHDWKKGAVQLKAIRVVWTFSVLQ